MLFSVGGVFAIYEGIEKIRHPHDIDSPAVAFMILGVAVVLEVFSLRTAVKESNHVRGALELGRRSCAAPRRPELPVVLLEDLGALFGLFFALTGLTLAVATGRAALGRRRRRSPSASCSSPSP